MHTMFAAGMPGCRFDIIHPVPHLSLSLTLPLHAHPSHVFQYRPPPKTITALGKHTCWPSSNHPAQSLYSPRHPVPPASATASLCCIAAASMSEPQLHLLTRACRKAHTRNGHAHSDPACHMLHAARYLAARFFDAGPSCATLPCIFIPIMLGSDTALCVRLLHRQLAQYCSS